MTHYCSLLQPLRRLARDEGGAVSVLNLFLTIAVCAIGAVALDVTHFYAAKTQLQVAADLAAHAALYTRRYGDYDESEEVYLPLTDDETMANARGSVNWGMPVSDYGPVVADIDIELDYLNWETRQVDTAAELPRGTAEEIADAATIIANGPTAATVVSHRVGTSAVSSFLFRIVGIESMDVRASSVFGLGPAECKSDQGFFSTNEVIINSGNNLYSGFCVGSPEFQAQNQNTYHAGVSVTLPNTALAKDNGNLDVVHLDSVHNPGLEQALYEEDTSALFERLGLDDVLGRLGGTEHAEALHLLELDAWGEIAVNPAAPADPSLNLPNDDNSPIIEIDPSDLKKDTIYTIDCVVPASKGKKGRVRSLTLTGAAGATFSDAVILTNCQVNIGQGIHLEDFILSTNFESTAPAHNNFAIASPSGLTIGRSESPQCDPSGGAALIATRSGVNIAAAAGFFGAVIRADGYVNFQSNGEGYGVSIVATGKIDTNSNNDMSACGPAPGAYSRNVSLRLVR